MRKLNIACANSCKAYKWANQTTGYGELKDRFRKTYRTSETVAQYAHMSRDEKTEAKDHGGIVAGVLIDGIRQIDKVKSRSAIMLDGDMLEQGFIEDFENRVPYTSFLYTTHGHTPKAPRARVVIPLTRDVTPDEFQAIARYLAQQFGIEQFDECSFRVNQLMFLPSTPCDGEYIFKEVEKEWLNPDRFLAQYPEWQDPLKLPRSSRERKPHENAGKQVQDPLTKTGIVGVFNRVYFPINKAVDTFLANKYEATQSDNRYHLIGSGSTAGVIVIEDKFIISFHAKDPAYQILCNAFDAVRLGLFKDLDEKASFKAMCDFAMQQDEVRVALANERIAEAKSDFADPEIEGDDEWKKKLKYKSRSTELENCTYNLRLILTRDKNLKCIRFNQLADNLEIVGNVPWKHPGGFWRDVDDAHLVCYLEDYYGCFSDRNLNIAVTKVADDRGYHPIKLRFESLKPWDGVKRVETLLIDYLGAEDNEYTRTVTRIHLCAGYKRIYVPGIKYDQILILNGPQGIGKSTIILILSMGFYSDCLTIFDMNDKTAAEKLQGVWFHEISELAGMKKADIDKVKAFISRRDDQYRAAFAKRAVTHPRQCLFFGTTNSETGYLRDITGNRRFWNVKVTGRGRYKPWDLTPEIVEQIWAEVKVLCENGQELYLPHHLESFAEEEQRLAMEQDDREGLLQEYLDTPLPANWNSLDIHERRGYILDLSDPTRPKGSVQRTEVSNLEIWCECFGKRPEDIQAKDSYNIAAMMKRLDGWERTNDRRPLPFYGRQRVYVRTGQKQPVPHPEKCPKAKG